LVLNQRREHVPHANRTLFNFGEIVGAIEE
jgi:hypothetical protein